MSVCECQLRDVEILDPLRFHCLRQNLNLTLTLTLTLCSHPVPQGEKVGFLEACWGAQIATCQLNAESFPTSDLDWGAGL